MECCGMIRLYMYIGSVSLHLPFQDFVQLGSSLSIGFGNFTLRLRVTIFFGECVKLVELGSLTDGIAAG